MTTPLKDYPCLFDGLFVMDLSGYTLYYNPIGFGGVTVADRRSQDLIGLCDGKHSVEELSIRLGRSSKEVHDDVSTLLDREVLKPRDLAKEPKLQSRLQKSLTCWIHLTNSCNLSCDYCYIHRSPGNMGIETAKTAVDKMLESCLRAGIPAISLKFSGGEPLLRFSELREIVEYTETTRGEIRARYVILTNGTLVTPEIAGYLAENHFGVGTSLDGLREVHDSARHTSSGRGSFADVLRGINILMAAGINPSVNATISAANYKEIRDLTAMFLDKGWRFRYSLERDTDTGSPAVLRYEAMVIRELMACYDLIEERLPERDINHMHQFGDVVFNRSVNRACGAGASFFSIGHDGQLGVCGLGLASPRGTLYDEGDLLENVRNSNSDFVFGVAKKYEGCSECTWRGSCAGACPLQTISTYGSHDRPSPYCEIYKAVLPRILRIKGLQMIRDYERKKIGGAK